MLRIAEPFKSVLGGSGGNVKTKEFELKGGGKIEDKIVPKK